MPGARAEEEYAARYAALYREHNSQLVAYARSLTGSATMAEDLAAEAHFRVWRRIQAGHEVENVAAYLTTTVRNLAAGLGRAQREISRDVAELPETHEAVHQVAAEDPAQRASHVDLITRLLKELPDRWAKALWYAEVEDLPMEAVGEKIGASAGTTAVVLTRARERLRQAFLLSQPGMPLSGECEPYWKHMATIVRGTASAKRTKNVTEHCDECEDCRSRMLALTEANTRLPALLGPAILAGVLGGGAWFVPGAIGAGAGAAAGTAARVGSRAGRHARLGLKARMARHGLSPTKVAVGSVAAVGIAATVATLALGSTERPAAAAQSTLRTLPASSQPTAVSRSNGASAIASAAATQAPATGPATQQAAAAPASSAPTTSASSASSVAALPASSVVAQTSQPQSPAAAPSATTPPATTPASTAAAAAPSTSASTVASPVTVVTPTPTPTPSQSSSPVLTPTPTPPASSSPVVTPTPTPSQTVTPTGSPTPTCYWYIFDFCFD
jgi:RNA polymerase sigma factor (sigma-70 family)